MLRNLSSLILFLVLSAAISQTAFAQQGELDTTFGTNNTGIYQDPLPTLPLPNEPGDRARYYGANEVLADGKIIVAGSALLSYIGNNGSVGYASDFLVRRLNANGSVDTTFGTNGEARTTFYRWGAGSYERSDNPTYVMKVQPLDGKIILASLCTIQGTTVPNGTPLGNDLCLVRYNANGTLDTSFGGNTVFSYGGNQNYPGNNNTVDPGKVFTLTGTNSYNGATNGFGGTPVKIQIAPDGRIFVFGRNSQDVPAGGGGYGRNKSFVAVYSNSGALQNITSIYDTTGTAADGYNTTTNIYDGDILSNGDFIAVGDQRTVVSSNPTVFSATRWKVFTGSSGGGFLESDVNTGGSARAITMLRSNKILVGGQTRGYSQFGVPTLVRYNSNLTVDTTFGINGRVVFDGTGNNTGIDTFYIAALKTQPDGKIMGITNNGHYPRFNPDGSFDRSWAKIRLDVADTLLNHGELSNYRFITPFPTVGGGNTGINMGNFAIRPNGRIVTAGIVGDGAISGPSARAVVTQITSYFRNGGTFSDFNNDGKSDLAVFRPSDGVWYQLDSFNGAFSAVQFGQSGDKIAPADYDGDGRSDKAVFRNGIWYVLNSSNNSLRAVQFGVAGDIPLPGDFNGDGQADLAVFRPASGVWYILYSNPIQPGNITFTAVQFGQSGDAPVLADFDGDGKSEIAVWRPSNGVWYYLRSTDGAFRTAQFGQSGDVPVTGDYDADGKSDIAIWRPSNGVWYRLNSSDGGLATVQFGQSGDVPTPGDYDNDGKNDLAVYRSGTWYVLRSSDNGFSAVNFGVSADKPVPSAYLP